MTPFTMVCGESMKSDNGLWEILKVPNGWIYARVNDSRAVPIFVPDMRK